MRGLRALVADENATAREIVADLLRARGCIVAEAACETDVKTAIAAADRRGARFGLFLVDSEMKSRDGYEAMRRIRDLEPKAAMVMLTNSNGLPAKLRRMREQSVQHYTTKPIKRQELYEVIAEALSKSAPPPKLPKASRKVPASAPAPPAIVNRPLKILLADDSPDNRLLIRAYGKKYPFTFSEAENGQVAVDLFIEGDFDLVLMDIQMPVLGGYDAVRAIRKWELEQDKKRTPIIALTASALDGDVQRARDAGCDMHLSKPIKKTTLLEAIAHAIEEVAARPAVEANRAASSSHFHI
jgi:CheY-like chemotaxis protein